MDTRIAMHGVRLFGASLMLVTTGCGSLGLWTAMGSTRGTTTTANAADSHSNPRTPPNITPASRPAFAEAQPEQTLAVRTGESGIAYETDRERTATPHIEPRVSFTDVADASPRQPAESVGVYGELVANVAPIAGNYDGNGNLSQITAATDGGCFDPDTSRDGKLLVLASTQHRRTADIYIKPVDGKTMTQITSDPADDLMPAWSPDASQIAFASNRDGNWNVYLTSVNGGPAMQLTDDGEQELHPTWSPDGRTIAYCKLGTQSGQWELWVIDLETRVQQFIEYGLFPQWNPDPARSKIAFQRARQRGSRLFSVWTIDYVNGEAMHPTEIVSAANAAAMHPAWSPDGTRLTFVTVIDPDQEKPDVPHESDVWVVDLDGRNRTNLTNGRFRNLYPTWGSDGRVYFLSDRSGVDNIWSVATGRTIELKTPRDSGLATASPDRQDPADSN